MPIIGKLLKETSKISAKRIERKDMKMNLQERTLRRLLRWGQLTAFGQNHHFSEILNAADFVKKYQESVSITDYNHFHDQWLHRAIEGERDVIWPGKVKYFALSSGTTGSPSKRIPVTRQMIRSFQRSSIKQFAATSNFTLSDGFYQKSFLAVGGSSDLVKVDQRIEGDLSGILKKHTSIVLSPLTKPDPETTAIRSWNEKLERMVELAPSWDISTIAGIPAWCILLMEKIVEKYQVDSIHDIWPNLEVYVYGGVYIEPYLQRFEKICGKPIQTINTYLASEGYFAYQKRPNTHNMQLLIRSGIFFEFVPFNLENFDEFGTIRPDAKALTLNEVSKDEDYALVISTNAGLWRYLIGDLVRFTSVEEREIRISGRIKQYLSLVGEHLSLDNINIAIQKAGEKLGVSIPEFTLMANSQKQNHCWYFGIDQEIDNALLMKTVDDYLKELNDDYASVRKYSTLGNPDVHCLPSKLFLDYMEANGKLGAQNKFPRVMTDSQAIDWEQFLTQITQ